MKLANTKIVKETMKHGREIVEVLSKNSPTILTGCAIAGAVAAVGLAIKATKPALKHIREEKIAHRDRIIITDGDEREDNELTEEEIEKIQLKPTEVAKAVWKDYIPTAVALAGTTACIIGAHSISAKRTAAMAALYSMSESALKEYKAKTEEVVGKGKAEKIHEELMNDKVRSHPITEQPIVRTGTGNTLCFDPFSGRYFYSDAQIIRAKINDLDSRIIGGDYRISLNEYYYELGLDGVKDGDERGWNVDCLIKEHFTSSLTSDGKPVLVIDLVEGPFPWYRET